jgi:AcrR family transcriptional regulator
MTETDTRCRIIATAEKFFREIGYQKTTVADIAKALKMSPANVYRFFSSKKAINEAVAEQLMGEVEGELRAIAERPGPAASRLGDFMRAAHRMNTERYTSDQKLHEMVEVAMTESWDVIDCHIERFNTLVGRIVADGVASGEFAVDDIATATRCAHTAFLQFLHPQMIVECGGEHGPSIDQMVAFVLKGLGHRATA